MDLPRTGDRYLSGIVSREGKSQRYNPLHMDDTPGVIGAQPKSVHGRSQLNLGYLTHPRQGFERCWPWPPSASTSAICIES